jgi:hypothetical protein
MVAIARDFSFHVVVNPSLVQDLCILASVSNTKVLIVTISFIYRTYTADLTANKRT